MAEQDLNTNSLDFLGKACYFSLFSEGRIAVHPLGCDFNQELCGQGPFFKQAHRSLWGSVSPRPTGNRKDGDTQDAPCLGPNQGERLGSEPGEG